MLGELAAARAGGPSGALATPALHCPFASRISPFHTQVEADNLAWLKQFGFAPTGVAQARLCAAAFGRLAARAYPDASVDGLRIAAAWASWLFLWDDRCDEEGIGRDPQAMRALSLEHLDVLTGRKSPRSGDRLAAALSDLSERMIAKAGVSWMVRFLNSTADYFEATAWEAENRRWRRVPDIATYVRLRDLTGAVKTCFDIHELADGGTLAVQARSHPVLSRMMQLANRAICWSNDIFSVDKELRHGDCHNLVLVIAHNTQVSLHEAVVSAARMHDAAVHSFERLEARLARNHQVPALASGYVQALKGWMRANLDWSIETGRYAKQEAASSR
jgi:Terpene synthase family 2, C-terminal metal binding